MNKQEEKIAYVWQEDRVAVLLAGVGGTVDAIGYLTFSGLFMGFMSGNSILLGLHLGQGGWQQSGRFAFTILVFTLGVIPGAILSNTNKRMILAFALEAVLLAIALCWQVWGNFSQLNGVTPDFFPRVALLAGAMGIQTGALRRVGGQSLHTTFVTGNLTSLAVLITTYFSKPAAQPAAQTGGTQSAPLPAAAQNGLLLWGVWVVYVLGAAAGAFAFSYQPREALLLPLFLLVVVIALSLFRPPDAVA